MLFPKKVKYRKWQTHRKHPDKIGNATRGLSLNFGSYGLKATSSARVKSSQIESARRVISRTLGKTGRYWIRIFPDRPVTAKAAEVGMGKGKGDLQGYVFEARKGRILFEIDNVSKEVATEALRKASTKLPMTARIVGKHDMY